MCHFCDCDQEQTTSLQRQLERAKEDAEQARAEAKSQALMLERDRSSDNDSALEQELQVLKVSFLCLRHSSSSSRKSCSCFFFWLCFSPFCDARFVRRGRKTLSSRSAFIVSASHAYNEICKRGIANVQVAGSRLDRMMFTICIFRSWRSTLSFFCQFLPHLELRWQEHQEGSREVKARSDGKKGSEEGCWNGISQKL